MRGRETKKGKVGPAAQYVTRTQALKILQVTLKDFRRLCILKGIFPRDPKKKLKGKDKTYYHRKDIRFLSHEPLLERFREFKTFLKKYTKARGRKEWSKAKHLQQKKPTFPLDHLVRERYPSFVDALRDLDDPLTMIHLFAGLQQKITRQHYTEHAETTQRLCREFQHYVQRSHALRKVFVSIKGIYYQCQIMGQDITWITPHKFSQHLPTDVDYRVMLTFLDFYMTLLKFVCFKLYSDVGLKYPPILDSKKADAGAALQAVQAVSKTDTGRAAAAETGTAKKTPMAVASTGAQQAVDSLVHGMNASQDMEEDADAAAASDAEEEVAEEQKARQDMEEFDKLSGSARGSTSMQAMNDVDEDARAIRQLFGGLSFFLSRETAQESLEFVLLCGGGAVYLDNEETRKAVADGSLKISHWVMDRPRVFNPVDDIEYVQPQWVYDSFNSRALLPVRFYTVGAALPPHLSPFVDDEKEGYIPKQRKMLEEWGAGAKRVGGAAQAAGDEEEHDTDEDEEEEEEEYQRGLMKEAAGVSYSEQKEVEKKKKKKTRTQRRTVDDSSEEEDDDSSEEEEDDDSEDDNDDDDDDDDDQKPPQKASKRKRAEEDAAAKEMAKIMMDKKSARLYQRMQTGIAKKKTAVQALETKRRKLEKEQKQKGKDKLQGDASMVQQKQKQQKKKKKDA